MKQPGYYSKSPCLNPVPGAVGDGSKKSGPWEIIVIVCIILLIAGIALSNWDKPRKVDPSYPPVINMPEGGRK